MPKLFITEYRTCPVCYNPLDNGSNILVDPYNILYCNFNHEKLNSQHYPCPYIRDETEKHSYYIIANNRGKVVCNCFSFMMGKAKIIVEIYYDGNPITKIMKEKDFTGEEMFPEDGIELITTIPEAIEPDFPSLTKLKNKIKMYFTFA